MDSSSLPRKAVDGVLAVQPVDGGQVALDRVVGCIQLALRLVILIPEGLVVATQLGNVGPGLLSHLDLRLAGIEPVGIPESGDVQLLMVAATTRRTAYCGFARFHFTAVSASRQWRWGKVV